MADENDTSGQAAKPHSAHTGPAHRHAEETPEQKARAFLERIREHDDVTIQGGGLPPLEKDATAYSPLDEATLKYLVAHGDIIELKKGEVSPNALYNNSKLKDDGHYDPPIYVVPGIGEDKKSEEYLGIKGGKAIYLMPEGGHNWNEDYVRQHIMYTDAELKQDPGTVQAAHYKPPVAEAHQYQELLAYASQAAGENNIPPPTLIINPNPDAPDMMSRQSAEGHEYIYISQKELNLALSKPEEMDALKKAIKTETGQIAEGENSPASLMAAKEKAQLDKDMQWVNKDKPALPINDTVLSDATLAKMEKDGSILKIPPDDLMPSAASNSNFSKKDKDGNALPVYLVPGTDGYDGQSPSSHVMHTAEGKQYVLINEAYHKQSAEYVRTHTMYSDADFSADQTFTKAADYKPAGENAARYEALLAHIKETATKDGREPTVLINPDPKSDAAYSLESQEKNNYIILSQKALEKGISSDAELATLEKSVDAEAARIQSGSNSPEKIVAEREASDFMNKLPVQNRELNLKDEHTVISSAALDALAQDKALIALGKNDLTPQASSDPVLKDAMEHGVPIYLVPMNNGGLQQSEPQAQPMTTKEGKPYILVNEGYHQWSQDYAREHMMTPEADIKKSEANRELMSPEKFLSSPKAQLPMEPHHTFTPEEQERYQAIVDFTAAQAKARGIKDPHILIDTTSNSKYADTEASTTVSKEDGNYIFIDKRALLDAISSPEKTEVMKGVVGHEVTHLANGDATPAGIIRDRNIKVLRNSEFLADLGGAGPLGTHNPEVLAKDEEKNLREEMGGYLAANPGEKMSLEHPTQSDLKKVAVWWQKTQDAAHPLASDRAIALHDEAAVMKKYEADFEQKNHRAVSSPQELQDEQKAVIAQVIKDMQAQGITITPHEDAPAPATSQQEAIKAAQKAMGGQQAVDAAPAAPMPAAIAKPPQQQPAQARN